MKSNVFPVPGGILGAGFSGPGFPAASSGATNRRAGRSKIPALPSTSANSTGRGTFWSHRRLPSFGIGDRKPLQATITRTLNVSWLWLPLASLALQRTVVVPSGNWAPDGGAQLTVGLGSTLSVAVAT